MCVFFWVDEKCPLHRCSRTGRCQKVDLLGSCVDFLWFACFRCLEKPSNTIWTQMAVKKKSRFIFQKTTFWVEVEREVAEKFDQIDVSSPRYQLKKGLVLGGSSHLGSVVKNHGYRFRPLSESGWVPIPFHMVIHGLWMGVILTTETNSDDPPSTSAVEIFPPKILFKVICWEANRYLESLNFLFCLSSFAIRGPFAIEPWLLKNWRFSLWVFFQTFVLKHS